MTPIPIAALKEMTIGKICELIKQAERLPDNRVVVYDEAGYISGITLKNLKPKTQTAQELLDQVNKENQEEKIKCQQ